MKYIKSFDQFVNESIVGVSEEDTSKPEVDSKVSLNERMYETIKEMYKDASNFEQNDNPTNTFESFLKESFVTLAEMVTLVIKENPEISKVAGIAALRKANEKSSDEDIVVERINEYLNDLMSDISKSYSGKMESMVQENPAIAMIAAKALSLQQSGNPDANNY